MSKKDLNIILGYDVNALKQNIAKHKSNIVIFTKAVDDAKSKIIQLESYIKLIEEAKGSGTGI